MIFVEPINLQGLTAIDLFSGAGGLSLSALNLELDLLAAVEFDSDACATYQANIIEKRSPATKLKNQDILELEPQDLREELDLSRGELDLLIGGPPCQGFSTHRIGDSGVDDPRNSLLMRHFDFVKEFSPKVFLVENVPGLLWQRHELYLQSFKKLARRNGYKVFKPIKINAKDFGVPQNRERVFILGVRSEIDVSAVEWPPKSTHFAAGHGVPVWQNASTVFDQAPEHVIAQLGEIIGKEKAHALSFGKKVASIDEDPSAIHMNHSPSLIERFMQTKINGGRLDSAFRLPCHSNNYRGHMDVYGRIRLAQPGPTITTGCFNPSKGRFLHPWKNHGITIRHAARFQTFPEDYVFFGGITSQGKQVGNAVPVALGEIMISAALKVLVAQEGQVVAQHG